MLNEIGSEFWLSEIPEANSGEQLPSWLTKWPHLALTSSGRGATNLAIKLLPGELISKTALLPAYCCHTMIDPFLQAGFEVFFYDIKKENLEPDLESVEKYIKQNIGVVLHMGYFGFETNKNLSAILEVFKNTGTKIIEDVTHTLFSDFGCNGINDFDVADDRHSVMRNIIEPPDERADVRGTCFRGQKRLVGGKAKRHIRFNSFAA